jgi:hypothetical protein
MQDVAKKAGPVATQEPFKLLQIASALPTIGLCVIEATFEHLASVLATT